jgi:hypothetical protein
MILLGPYSRSARGGDKDTPHFYRPALRALLNDFLSTYTSIGENAITDTEFKLIKEQAKKYTWFYVDSSDICSYGDEYFEKVYWDWMYGVLWPDRRTFIIVKVTNAD